MSPVDTSLSAQLTSQFRKGTTCVYFGNIHVLICHCIPYWLVVCCEIAMSFSEPFPEGILREIRDYPGNIHCCDCRSLDTDWGSISHGTLICLDCAGKHRSLGVQVSFVRSISMDSWSPQQVLSIINILPDSF